MPEKPDLDATNEPGQLYQIRVKGHLSPLWHEKFDGLTITPETNGDTVLTGPVVDQAALHGLLRKIRDLGIPLLAVIPIESELLPGQ